MGSKDASLSAADLVAVAWFQNMPAEGSDLIMSARAELITAEDPYFRGIGADASLPHCMTIRPLASASPGGPHIVDLVRGRGWLIYTFMQRHTDPQIIVTEALWA
ncbi:MULTISPECIES: hypothetical protein [Streptomyces]|uniref:hypothetical protein n=1 Tax=Streptomyces TaxID=1883 RepID=UPI00067BAE7F|nr:MULTISPECIES: hypothetical protein [Streptomyces]MDG9682604.1 hypothetical protein [Streptomyces sp. DH18]